MKGQEEAVAFGRRLALFLNGECFSLGAYPALYVFLTQELSPSEVKLTDDRGEWWHRYVHVGVPAEFPNLPEASEIVKCATVAALKTIRPDLVPSIDAAADFVRTHGGDLRFLLRTRATKRFVIEISFSIAVWPESSSLFTSVTDRVTGEYLEGPPLLIAGYQDAFDYNGPIKVREVEKERAGFLPKARPAMSKIVRRRG